MTDQIEKVASVMHSVGYPFCGLLIDSKDEIKAPCTTCKQYGDWYLIKQDAPNFRCVYCQHNALADLPKVYRYFMTWTKRPDVSTDVLLHTFQKFVDRSEVLQIKRLWTAQEHWDTNAHIHAYVEATRSLPRSRYAYYEKITGKIDKRTAKGTLQQIRDYMSKESDLKELI